MNRREFLKSIGAGTIAIGTASISACGCEPSKPFANIGEMTYRTNSSTGDKVSILGYGMMRLPMMEGENRSRRQQNVDQEQVNKLVEYAIKSGINYFDTSPVYCQGKSEQATGEALSRYPRDKYFVATKLSNFDPSAQTLEGAKRMYQKSRESLKVDYIDYYLLHSVGGSIGEFNRRFVDNGMLDFLLKEREEGRIRNLGFSFHGSAELFDEMMNLHEKYHWDFVQIQMNYYDWNNTRENNQDKSFRNFPQTAHLYEQLEAHKISAVIMEPLLGGRLSKEVPEGSVREMKRREPDMSIASWAFRWCGTKSNVLTCLSGMTYMEHLEDNVRTFCPLRPLTDEEIEFVDDVAKRVLAIPNVPCTGCQYCMPCPYGIDIPGIFSYYNTHKMETDRFLAGYNGAIEPARQADHCIQCGQCQTHCPQHIRIPEKLAIVDEFVEKLKRESVL